MTPRLGQILTATAACLLIAGSLAYGLDSCHRKAGTQAEVQANIASGEANAHQTQAQASDKVAADLKAQLASREADLGRVITERDGLLKRMAAKPVPHLDHANPVPGSDLVDALETAVADRDEVIAKDAEVIGKLEADSVVKDSLITALTIKSDEWKATAKARERQAAALQAALSSRPTARNWSAGVRIEQKPDGTRQYGATARRDLGPGYVEVSGSSDRAGFGFGWRW